MNGLKHRGGPCEHGSDSRANAVRISGRGRHSPTTSLRSLATSRRAGTDRACHESARVTKDELRIALLRMTNDVHDAGRLPMNSAEYLNALNLDEEAWTCVSNGLKYLWEKGFIVASGVPVVGRMGAAFVVSGITPAGIDEVELTSRRGVPRPAGDVHFHGPVGSAQIGDHNTASVVQNVSADVSALVDALIALRDATADDASQSAAHALAEQAIGEVSAHNSVTARLNSLLLGIGNVIQSSGAALPAYRALYLAAPHLGIHGLPPPPSSS